MPERYHGTLRADASTPSSRTFILEVPRGLAFGKLFGTILDKKGGQLNITFEVTRRG